MKLPENKQERQKILLMIGIGIAAALYGVWAFIYEPKLSAKAAAREEIAVLKEKIDAAEVEIRRMPATKRNLEAAYSNLIEISETHMLHPRLGSSYILPAREMVTRHARALNMEGVTVEEIGLIALPRPKAKAAPKPKPGQQDAETKTASASGPTPTIQTYGARVNATSAYEDLRKLVAAMEKENPFMVISNISIAAQPGTPLAHKVTFEVFWPAWIDPNQREVLIENENLLIAEGEKQ